MSTQHARNPAASSCASQPSDDHQFVDIDRTLSAHQLQWSAHSTSHVTCWLSGHQTLVKVTWWCHLLAGVLVCASCVGMVSVAVETTATFQSETLRGTPRKLNNWLIHLTLGDHRQRPF